MCRQRSADLCEHKRVSLALAVRSACWLPLAPSYSNSAKGGQVERLWRKREGGVIQDIWQNTGDSINEYFCFSFLLKVSFMFILSWIFFFQERNYPRIFGPILNSLFLFTSDIDQTLGFCFVALMFIIRNVYFYLVALGAWQIKKPQEVVITLFVCKQDFVETTWPISMKRSGRRFEVRKDPFLFAVDLWITIYWIDGFTCTNCVDGKTVRVRSTRDQMSGQIALDTALPMQQLSKTPR